jgi:cell division protein FtsL
MATRARKRGPLKGRALVAIGLALFVTVAVLVVWRRSLGAATEHEMRKLRQEKRALESQKITLDRELRDAISRNRIVPAAEKRLGLHVAAEGQLRLVAPDSSPTP